jgi:YihY family inner membrane protein
VATAAPSSKRPPPVPSRLDRFQRRHPSAGFPLAVLYKFIDDNGSYLAALLTYYAFVSLFPLLLLLSTILGLVLAGHPDLQQRVLSSAVSQFPVVGKQIGDPRSIGGGPVGLVIGVVLSVYGGLGVAQAAQYAMNTAWRVPRDSRPNPFLSRLRSLGLLVTAGVTVLLTTVLSAVGGSHVGGVFGPLLRVTVLVASVAINIVVFVVAFRVSTARRLSTRDVVPGAVAAAVVWQALQSFGVVYVHHVVGHANDTNAVFAVVLGLLAFLYLTSLVVVLAVQVNVVRVEKLHPRSLLAPFTDDTPLTEGDKEAYADQARAQRMKSQEDIDVRFDSDGRSEGTTKE